MRTRVLVLAALALPSALAAQLPASFNPRSLALGGAYTSIARGWEASLSNPAMLAALGRPGFTLGLPNVGLETGSNSYSLSDFRKYANRTLSDEDKAYLLGRITEDDSALTLRTIAGAAPVGLSIGPVAFAAYTIGYMDVSMGADAVELLLYGNAHRSAPGDAFTARGSGGSGWAATTLAGSIAFQIAQLPMGRLAVGATYKRILGHSLGRASETSSSFVVNPQFQVSAAGHAVYTDRSDCGESSFSLSSSSDPCSLNAGAGYGVDVGAVLQMRGRAVTLSAVLVNAVGSMSWEADRFIYERTANSLAENPDGSITEDTTRILLRGAAIEGDPIARGYRDSLLAHSDFARVLRVGAALRRGGWLTLTMGGSLRLADGLDPQPAQTLSAGGEMRLLKILPLRAGVTTDLGKTIAFSAGSGIQLLGLNVDASIASISGSDRPGVVVGVGASILW
jgi:hypothetical protein